MTNLSSMLIRINPEYEVLADALYTTFKQKMKSSENAVGLAQLCHQILLTLETKEKFLDYLDKLRSLLDRDDTIITIAKLDKGYINVRIISPKIPEVITLDPIIYMTSDAKLAKGGAKGGIKFKNNGRDVKELISTLLALPLLLEDNKKVEDFLNKKLRFL